MKEIQILIVVSLIVASFSFTKCTKEEETGDIKTNFSNSQLWECEIKYHPAMFKEIHSTDFLGQKMEYIHNNPLRAEIVVNPEDYLYSSARDYSGEKGLVNIEFV